MKNYSSNLEELPPQEPAAAVPGARGMKSLTLRANFLWTLFGTVAYSASQWGILVVLAKLGTPEMVGQFALALAITAPVMIGAGLSLRSVQVTDAAFEYPFGDYLSLRLITTALAMLVILAVLGFSHYGWHVAAIIAIVGLAKGFESISDIFYGLLQLHEQMDRIALSMAIKGPLSLAVVVVALCTGGDLLTAMAAMAAVWALLLVAYDLPNGVRLLRNASGHGLGTLAKTLQLHSRLRPLAPLALLALPAGIVLTLISFNANIPRYFIERQLGLRELGIFAAMVYPMVAGALIVNGLGQSAFPRLARHYAAKNRRAFSGLLFKLAGIATAIGGAGVLTIWLAGDPILRWLYGAEYAAYAPVFLWLGVATAISYPAALFGYGMAAARYFRAQLPVFLVVTLVTAGASALFIPHYQLLGAAFAIAAATLCQAMGSAIVLFHALRR